jgi:hypothetical protein
VASNYLAHVKPERNGTIFLPAPAAPPATRTPAIGSSKSHRPPSPSDEELSSAEVAAMRFKSKHRREREALASLLRATQPNPNGRRPSTHPPSPRRHRNRPSAHLARLARMAAAGSCSQIQRRGVGRPPWHLDDSDSKLKAASGSSTSRQRRGGGGPPSRWPSPIPIAVGGGRHPRRRRGARLALGG